MARYTGADCRRCRREKMKLFLKGSKCDGPKCPFESRPFPPGQHGRGRTEGDRVPAAAAREAEGPPHLRRAGEAVPHATTRRPTAARARPVRSCCRSSSRGWTTWSTGPATPSPATWRASSSSTATSLVNGKKVDIPSYRVTRARHRRRSGRSPRELTPFVVAQAEAGSQDRAGLAGGDPQPDEDPGPLAPGPAGHRHAGPGAAHRRALLASSRDSSGGRRSRRATATVSVEGVK